MAPAMSSLAYYASTEVLKSQVSLLKQPKTTLMSGTTADLFTTETSCFIESTTSHAHLTKTTTIFQTTTETRTAIDSTTETLFY